MSLNDKLIALRDLLHSIEEEDGDAYKVALDMVVEHVERGTGAGMVIAREWLECGAYTVWLDSGYVTAVKLESQRGGIKPVLPFARIWCPVRHTVITANLYEHPAHAASIHAHTYAFCESDAAYERWAASLRGEVRFAAPGSWARQEPTEPLRWTLTDAGPGALGLGAELRGVQIPEGDLYQAPPAAAFAQVLDGYRRRREATVPARAQVLESAAGTYTFRAASGEWVSQDGRPSIPHPTDPPALPSEEE